MGMFRSDAMGPLCPAGLDVTTGQERTGVNVARTRGHSLLVAFSFASVECGQSGFLFYLNAHCCFFFSFFFLFFPFNIRKIGGNLRNQQSASCWYSSPVLSAMEKMSHLRLLPPANNRTSSLFSTVEKK